jgi:hypothetical protein
VVLPFLGKEASNEEDSADLSSYNADWTFVLKIIGLRYYKVFG